MTEDQRHSQLLERLLLCILLGGFASLTIPFAIDLSSTRQFGSPRAFPLVPMLFISMLLGVNRMGYYRPAAFLAATGISIAIFTWTILSDGSNVGRLGYLVVPIVLASVFLSKRVLAALILVNLAGLLVLPLILRGAHFAEMPLVLLALVSALIFLARRHREALEERTQSQLRESAERYRGFVEHSADGVWRIDLAGRFTYANPVTFDMLGYNPQDLVGEPMSRVLTREGAEQAAASLKRRKSTEPAGGTKIQELMHVRKDGSEFLGEVCSGPIRDAAGELVEIQGVTRDITDRKRTEASLRENAALLQTLMNNIPDSIYFKDTQLRFAKVNKACARLMGLPTPDDIVGKSDADFFAPEDARRMGQQERRIIETGEPLVDFIEEDRLQNGQNRWVSTTQVPIVDAGGQVASLVGISRDITDRKHAEEELRFSKDLLRTVLDIVPAFICAKNRDGRFILVNKKLTDFYATTVDAMTGTLHADVCEDEQELRAMLAADREVIESGIPKLVPEETMESPDGSVTVLETHKIPFEVNDEPSVLIAAIDITARKEAEEAHRQLEDQLRQAQKMEAIGQLAGGIAHDFNNMLQAILGYGDLALEEAGPEAGVCASIEEMLKASQRAKTLVSQLLAFSRRQVLDMKDIDLNVVISDLMKMIRRVIGEHITLDILLGHDLEIIRADPGQVEQILTNLCVNARDAMPEGGGITIQTENALLDAAYCQRHTWAEPGRYVLLTVTDTGCGMDGATLANIFEPFFTTKGVGEGTGLGLSMVYGLVKQHQGLIHAHSEVGTGTAFRIYLPQTKRPAETTGGMARGPAPGGQETILLAEDDTTVRRLSKAILKHAGYTVLTARDGEEALRLFDQHAGDIDLALLDVMMPKLGGRAVFEQIRETRPSVRALFASGYSMDAIHTSFVLDKGLQLIQKPYQRDDLLLRVRKVLDNDENGASG